MPGLMTARRTLLTLGLGVALFAGSYGVGSAGEGNTSEPAPAAAPEIGDLEPFTPLPALAQRPRPKKAPEPTPPVVTQPEPEPQPETTPTPVQPVTPAPRPAPTPAPSPTPAPPAPDGGFDDSG